VHQYAGPSALAIPQHGFGEGGHVPPTGVEVDCPSVLRRKIRSGKSSWYTYDGDEETRNTHISATLALVNGAFGRKVDPNVIP
jgi:hypothetical protein